MLAETGVGTKAVMGVMVLIQMEDQAGPTVLHFLAQILTTETHQAVVVVDQTARWRIPLQEVEQTEKLL
jgi:predicted GTPase